MCLARRIRLVRFRSSWSVVAAECVSLESIGHMSDLQANEARSAKPFADEFATAGDSSVFRSELVLLAREAKDLARRYYQLTGKPLGVTGEIAELEAARLLGLRLAGARQAGWDATRVRADRTLERIQIKGRWLMNGYKPAARMGAIDPHDDFDTVMLVLLDAQFEVRSISTMSRPDVRALLDDPGSRARNERGALSIGAFLSRAKLEWVCDEYRLPQVASGMPPGPIEVRLAQYLSSKGVLTALCGPKRAREYNRRESLLEQAVAELLQQEASVTRVERAARIGRTLGLEGTTFPLQTMPDIVVESNGAFDVYEVKSGRVDYSRFDRVVGKDMRAHLDAQGLTGISPWEVEQDLLRLQAYRRLAVPIRRTMLVLVDAYAGTGRSWSRLFARSDHLREALVTPSLKAQAEVLVANARILPVESDGLAARLILVEVPATVGAS